MAGKAQTIRWSFEMAGAEFGMDRRVVATRAKTAGIEPGKDGKYSTFDIARAIFGDIQGEQLRKTREEADKIALANAKDRNKLVETERVIKFCNGIGVVLRQKLLASSLTDDEKDELLAEIKKLFDSGTVTEQVCAAA